MESLRCGTKWLHEEDEKLKESINNNKSFEEIASEHKRSINAIKCRIVSHIIYPFYKDNKDNKNNDIFLNELSSKYNIEKFYIEKYINKLDTNNSIKSSINNNKNNDSNKLLINKNDNLIEFRLNKIEEKLNYIINMMNIISK